MLRVWAGVDVRGVRNWGSSIGITEAGHERA